MIICCFCSVIWMFLLFFLGTGTLPSQLEWFHVAGCVLFIGASLLQHHSMILLAKLRTGQSGDLLYFMFVFPVCYNWVVFLSALQLILNDHSNSIQLKYWYFCFWKPDKHCVWYRKVHKIIAEMVTISLSLYFSVLFQEKWSHWLTECQLVVGLNWSPVHTTLRSWWSTSHLAWFLVACPWPGGWLSFMSSLTRHWLHNFVMNFILAGSNHTQSIGKHLFHFCYEEVVCVLMKWEIA